MKKSLRKIFGWLRPAVRLIWPVAPALCLGAFVTAALTGYKPPVPEQYEVSASESVTVQNGMEKTEEKKEDEEKTKGEIFELEDGVYRGSGTGYGGTVTVDVTIGEKAITDISIVSASGETPSFFERAKGVIDSIIKSQATDVDVVSGATYSSRGIIDAVKNALYGTESEGTTAKKPKTDAPKLTNVKEDGEYKDGTYAGSAKGFGGTIKVSVTIKNGKISDIKVTSAPGEGASYLKKAKGLIPTMIKKQSTNVDAASGATFSSNGLIQAVRNALSKAKASKKEEKTESKKEKKKEKATKKKKTKKENTKTDEGLYKDGTYTGTGKGFRGDIKVSLTIKDGKITAVDIKERKDDDPFFGNAKDGIIPEVLNQQSADVDTVSGATYSSKGILEAIKDALSKAKKKSDSGKKTDPDKGTTEKKQDTTQKKEDSPESTTEKKEDPKEDASQEKEDSSETTTEEEQETEQKYKDGSYAVTAKCEWGYQVSMTVEISGGKITDVHSVSITSKDEEDKLYMNDAVNGIVPKIKQKGNANGVDVVSGATYSSKALIEGCKKALREAAK